MIGRTPMPQFPLAGASSNLAQATALKRAAIRAARPVDGRGEASTAPALIPIEGDQIVS